jgi:hypothetical protein
MTSSSSSRAASPALSHSSKASVEEEVEHERERNWNSSRPNWSKRNSIGSLRPGSPSPLQQGSTKQTPVRQRTQSLKNTPSPPSDSPNVSRSRLGRSSLSQISPSPPNLHRSRLPKNLQLPLSQPDIVVSPSTPPRPSVSRNPNHHSHLRNNPTLAPGGNYPPRPCRIQNLNRNLRIRNDLPQPPASPERPPRDSRIPVRASTSAVKLDDISKPKEAGTTRHRRSFTEFHQANGAIPPRVSVQTLLPPRNLAPEDVLHSM